MTPDNKNKSPVLPLDDQGRVLGKEILAHCRSGALGCVDCKKMCAANISAELAPILERRKVIDNTALAISKARAAGVKIGCGNCSAIRKPAGSAMPQTEPVCW